MFLRAPSVVDAVLASYSSAQGYQEYLQLGVAPTGAS